MQRLWFTFYKWWEIVWGNITEKRDNSWWYFNRNKKIEKVVMTFDKDKTEDEKAKNKSNEDE